MINNYIANKSSYGPRIYNQSGALSDLLKKIDDPEIQTLEKILQFKKDYPAIRKKMLKDSIEQVKLRISKMESELTYLLLERYIVTMKKSEELGEVITRLEGGLMELTPQHNLFKDCYSKIKRWLRDRTLKNLRNNFPKTLHKSIKVYDKQVSSLHNRIKDTHKNLEMVANNEICDELHDLGETHRIIEAEKYLMAGAIGEERVITELKMLPYSYHVINDFKMKFDPPIYNRAENDRIFSIQIDHLVVGPSGIFIIETKYWSDKSISEGPFFSPVKQVKRAGFALFVVLNDAVKSGYIDRLTNNWGLRKISPKQIVVSINSVPHGEFQYVKVLGIDQLNSHITYGRQEYTSEEVQSIVEHLLELEL